jgi:hypothetical protein
VKDEDAIANAARRARRRARVPEGAVCLMCGEPDLGVLRAVDRSLLDNHHVAGIANIADLTVWLCPTCHRKLHVRLLDKGLDFRDSDPRLLLNVVVYVLEGAGALFAQMAEYFEILAKAVRAQIAALDARFDEWRQLPESTY